jgi:hypothetical protein
VDVGAEEEVVVRFARAGVIGVEIYVRVEGGGGFEGAGIDCFEGEVCGGLDCGLMVGLIFGGRMEIGDEPDALLGRRCRCR